MAQPRQDGAVPCPDTACVDAAGNRSLAEPEQDGDVQYHECPVCSFAFGYQRVEQVAVNAEGSCAVGIPEDLRIRASAAMQNALADEAKQQPPLLQIGRRSDA